MLSPARKAIATTLAVCMLGAGMPSTGSAAMISSDAAISGADRERIVNVLERAELRAQLQSLGVKPADVQARVAAMSDLEAAQLAAQLDQLPAGGDGVGAVVGALLIIFLVLLITDILGLTKVFPFTKPMK